MRLNIFVFPALFLLFLAPLGAQDARADRVRQVLDVTGTARQLSDGPNLMRALLNSQPAGDNKMTALLLRSVGRAFADNAFVAQVERQLLDRYDDELAQRVLRQYESPLFLSITACEVEADQAGLDDDAARFDWSSLPPDRARLFEDYAAASKMDERTGAVVSLALRSFLAVLNLALPENRRITKPIVDVLVAQAVETTRTDEARQKRLSRLAVLYRNYTDAELGQYFGFCTTPEGEWLSDNCYLGLGKAFEECLRRTANEVTEALRENT